jgi:hypothetical protein
VRKRHPHASQTAMKMMILSDEVGCLECSDGL